MPAGAPAAAGVAALTNGLISDNASVARATDRTQIVLLAHDAARA